MYFLTHILSLLFLDDRVQQRRNSLARNCRHYITKTTVTSTDIRKMTLTFYLLENFLEIAPSSGKRETKAYLPEIWCWVSLKDLCFKNAFLASFFYQTVTLHPSLLPSSLSYYILLYHGLNKFEK